MFFCFDICLFCVACCTSHVKGSVNGARHTQLLMLAREVTCLVEGSHFGCLFDWLVGCFFLHLFDDVFFTSLWSDHHISSLYLVMWSSVSLFVCSYVHLVNIVMWSSGQYGLLVIWSSGHLVNLSSGHLVIWSSGHMVFSNIVKDCTILLEHWNNLHA